MKKFYIIIAIINVVLGIMYFIVDPAIKSIIIPFITLGLGVLYIFDSVALYKENKKTTAIFIFLLSILIIIVAIIMFIKK